MYKKNFAALENGAADSSLLPQVAELAERLGFELLLVHVADGWVARNFARLKLAESEEIKNDRAYLERRAGELRGQGLTVAVQLALGDPPAEIVRTAEHAHCDLIAMGSHGHRLFGDIVLGARSTRSATGPRFRFCSSAPDRNESRRAIRPEREVELPFSVSAKSHFRKCRALARRRRAASR